MAAVGEMLLDVGAQLGRDRAIDVVGNLSPHMFAIQNHDPPALLRNNPNIPPFFVFKRGARIFCIISRARNSRVLTTPSLTPKAFAVSAILNSSTSRRSNTSR